MNIEKDNFFVITGGPGGGKTAVLHALAEKGFACVRETARQMIKDRLEKGLPPRPEPSVFARELFQVDFDQFRDNL